MRILVAEDDAPLASFLSIGLSAEQYAVDLAHDGEVAGHLAREIDYDLLILDLSLPRTEGIRVLKEVRQRKPDLPIIVLTARSQTEERIRVLNLGADDYLSKPFSLHELSARVRAVMRRAARPAESLLRVDDLELDRVNRAVRRAGKRIDLTPKEFALLEYLMRNAGQPVTRNMIIENVWNLSFDTTTNVIDVYINYLRNKIDEHFEKKLIRTLRGVGYKITSAEHEDA